MTLSEEHSALLDAIAEMLITEQLTPAQTTAILDIIRGEHTPS